MDERNINSPAAPETRAERRAAERTVKVQSSSRRWRRFLVIYAAVWLLAAALGCTVFYKYLRAYEQSLPDHVMDSLMEDTAPETWLGYVRAAITAEASEFDNADALCDEYESVLLAGKTYSYRRAAESSAEEPSYIVRCGGVDVCTVRLTPKPDSNLGFGKHLWSVGEIEPCEALGNLRSTAVEILALESKPVYINGVALTEAQIAERDIPIDGMTEIEARFTAVPRLVRYRVERMYGSITVTDADGAELAPEADEGDGITRYVLPLQRYSVSITAPSDITVTLCGAALTQDDAESVDAGILRGLDEYTGERAYSTVRWTFEGLYAEPDVRSYDTDGTELTPLVGTSGQLLFFHANNEQLQNDVQDTVKAFFNRYIDYSSNAFLGSAALASGQTDAALDAGTRASLNRYYGLLACILESSDFYRYIQNSTDAMIWASATKVDYEELTFTDFSYVSDNCFVCTVRYKADFTASQWAAQKNYNVQNAYELVFVNPDGSGWLAAAMDAVTE